MKKEFECYVESDQDAVFGALADVIQPSEVENTRQWAVKVSVNPSRFGVDEAISIRRKSNEGDAEIGKLLIRPIRGGRHLLTVPNNRTGGAAPPELDPDGRHFYKILDALLNRLEQLGLYLPPETSRDKEPIGFRRPGR